MRKSVSSLSIVLMLLSLIKLVALQRELGLLSYLATFLAASLVVLAIIYLPLNLIGGVWHVRVGLSTHALLTFVVFADLVYTRYFCSVVPIQSVFLLGEATGVMDSISSLLRPTDMLLFVDSLAILWLLKTRKGKWELPKRQTVSTILLGVLLLSLLGMGYTIATQAMGRPHVLAQFGALPYHVYDVFTTLSRNGADGDYGQLILQQEQAWMRKGREHFGLVQGRNVVVIQLEAMQDFLIKRRVEEQEITPVLNSLIANDSFYFSNYYQVTSLGSTSDAEFASHNSLYPSLERASYQLYEGKSFYTLPLALKKAGYSTAAFHGYKADFWNRERFYPGQGLDAYYSEEDFNMDETIGMGLSDGSFFRQAAAKIQDMAQPFYSFLVTLSSHHPWVVPSRYRELNLPDDLEGTVLGNYLQSSHYVDQAIGEFLQALRAAGLYENTAFVIYGDHFGMRVDDPEMYQLTSKLLGYAYDYEEMLNVPLIIHVPGMGNTHQISTTGGQVDLFPTMLNLLGLEKDPTAVLAGQDLLNVCDGLVALRILGLEKGSFVDNNIMFEMSRDGVFEHSRAWDLRTRQQVSIEPYRVKSRRAELLWDFSAWMLENDLVRSPDLFK